MREERTVQSSIFDLFAGHEIGQELKAMSRWLDEQAEVVGWVAGDLGGGVKRTGRRGLSAESVLRCALLKQHRQLSYEEFDAGARDLRRAYRHHPFDNWQCWSD